MAVIDEREQDVTGASIVVRGPLIHYNLINPFNIPLMHTHWTIRMRYLLESSCDPSPAFLSFFFQMLSGAKKYYAQVTALEKVSAIGYALLTRKSISPQSIKLI